MDHEMIGKAEPDAKTLTFDVPDDALERAAGATIMDETHQEENPDPIGSTSLS